MPLPKYTLAPEEANVLRLVGQRDKVTMPELGVVLHLTPSEIQRWVGQLVTSGLASVDTNGTIVSVMSRGRDTTHVLASGTLADAKVHITIDRNKII